MADAAAGTTVDQGGSQMANRNQRGPQGQGPMTGRGLGHCNGNENTENRADVAPAGGGRGRGLGNRRGLGQGQGQGQGRGGGLGRGKGQGLGRGQGRGPGRGPGRRFDGAPSQDDQSSLVAEVRALRAELAALKNTINDPGEDQ